ncbi:antibiotic biosynthesis monooxygenase [Nocardiopsis sp. NPDC049922]|uniref:putative quinol monooxygenase n=1 Tax=Nocardiopsis sp. NPDC049922 TaxID=3155157 RepID=UPI0033F52AE7
MPLTFGLVVRFALKEDAGQAFDQLVEDTVAKIRENEAGTLVYTCHTVEGQPAQRVFYELYRDEKAFAEHERQPHVRAFLAEREKYVESFEVDRLRLTTGKGHHLDGQ